MSAVNRNGSRIWGRGRRCDEPVGLVVLDRRPLGAERGRVREIVRLAIGDEDVEELGVVLDARRGDASAGLELAPAPTVAPAGIGRSS